MATSDLMGTFGARLFAGQAGALAWFTLVGLSD
jgi:hypothetical protein